MHFTYLPRITQCVIKKKYIAKYYGRNIYLSASQVPLIILKMFYQDSDIQYTFRPILYLYQQNTLRITQIEYLFWKILESIPIIMIDYFR